MLSLPEFAEACSCATMAVAPREKRRAEEVVNFILDGADDDVVVVGGVLAAVFGDAAHSRLSREVAFYTF